MRSAWPDRGEDGATPGAWQVELPLRQEMHDYLGHVTAVEHGALVEAAHTRWFGEVTGEARPAFVLARLELDFHRELHAEDGPAIIAVVPVRLTRSSVVLAEQVRTSARGLHTSAGSVLVRWDLAGRRSTPFSDGEREVIARHMRDVGTVTREG